MQKYSLQPLGRERQEAMPDVQKQTRLKGKDCVWHVPRCHSAWPGSVSPREILVWRMTCSQETKGHKSQPSGGLTTGHKDTHRRVVEAIAVRKPWFGGQARAGEGAEQAGLELEGFAAAASTTSTSGDWGVRQGALSWAVASPGASPAPGLLTRQIAGREQAV